MAGRAPCPPAFFTPMSFATEMADLAAAVSGGLAVAVTLTRPAPGTLNTTTGQRTGPSKDFAVSAVRANEDVGARGAGGGALIQRASRVYHVDVTDSGLAGAEPERGWTITDGDDTYEIGAVAKDCGGAMWRLTTAGSA